MLQQTTRDSQPIKTIRLLSTQFTSCNSWIHSSKLKMNRQDQLNLEFSTMKISDSSDSSQNVDPEPRRNTRKLFTLPKSLLEKLSFSCEFQLNFNVKTQAWKCSMTWEIGFASFASTMAKMTRSSWVTGWRMIEVVSHALSCTIMSVRFVGLRVRGLILSAIVRKAGRTRIEFQSEILECKLRFLLLYFYVIWFVKIKWIFFLRNVNSEFALKM